MSALPQDIALYTTDGVLLKAPTNDAVSTALKSTHVNARRMDETEREMFFDLADDGQVILNEAFALLSVVNPAQFGVETAETLGLGQEVSFVPNVPCYTVTNRDLSMKTVARTRAYSMEYGSDRYAIEVLGQPAERF